MNATPACTNSAADKRQRPVAAGLMVMDPVSTNANPDGGVTVIAADVPTGTPETVIKTTAGSALYATAAVALPPAVTFTSRVTGVPPNVPRVVRTLRATTVYRPGATLFSVVVALSVRVKPFGPVTRTSAEAPAARPEMVTPREPGEALATYANDAALVLVVTVTDCVVGVGVYVVAPSDNVAAASV